MLAGQFALRLVQAIIRSLGGKQLVVVSFLDDSAAFKDDQPVGAAKRAEAVGDGDRRAALHEIVEGGLDFALGFRVHG